jgi:hypothetical protein
MKLWRANQVILKNYFFFVKSAKDCGSKEISQYCSNSVEIYIPYETLQMNDFLEKFTIK